MVNYHSQPSGPLKGAIRVPSDKSISHRAVILSSIAEGTSILRHLLMGEDNKATMNAMQAMGASIQAIDSATYQVEGVGLYGLQQAPIPLNMGNSGTGLRLLTGLLAGQSFESQLVGDQSLMKRPMKRIVVPLKKMGALIATSLEGTPPLHILPAAFLHGIQYSMPVASAQVKSCLLLAGLYADSPTEIIEPVPTRNYTEQLLSIMGAPIQVQGSTITLKRCQRLNPLDITIPADISSAAFFMVAATIIPGSELVLQEVGINPTRTGIINILKAMGADIQLENISEISGESVADIRVRSAQLTGIEIPVDQVPLAIDEMPVILIAAACAKGNTLLRGAEELRVKESDRIAAMADGLERLGIVVEVFSDGMHVEGGGLQGGEVDSFSDHRIAMSFLMAGAVASGPVIVRDCDNIETSFPDFIATAANIGLRIEC
jgi:3-phosphoshikimate 1-carboxyvinyltransferase